jgi:uncharacterized protein (TIGR02421 family)
VTAAGPEKSAVALEGILEAVTRSLALSGRVRRNLPDGGRLYIDRPTPFLCVYRKSAAEAEPRGDATLPTTQAAFLVAGGVNRQARRVCDVVAAELSQRFGGFLLIELWPAAMKSSRGQIKIHAPSRRAEDPVLAAARQALGSIRLYGGDAHVRTIASASPAPPRRAPLLDAKQLERFNALLIGIEYPPVFRDGGSTYHPAELRKFRSRLGTALQKIFFEFAKGRDPKLAATHEALASREVRQAAAAVDRRLAEVSSLFDFLLYVTPVDVEERWEGFRSGRYAKDPSFAYRPLPFEPRELKRLLYSAPIEKVEDPLLWELFAHKQNELDRQITLLSDRGSRRFQPGAIALYGGVDEDLLALSRFILDSIGAAKAPKAGPRRQTTLCAEEIANRAEAEIAYYRTRNSDFEAGVEIRSDIAAAMMVSQNRLLISNTLRLRPERLEPLLHHEVGTHLLTWFNGGLQPLRLLQDGAAGYEPTQEGLAVLAEYASGGLTMSRLRILAARVETVHCMVDGASFVETFHHLRDTRGFGPHAAFRMTARVYRGGGLTKDAAYLRGLRDLLVALSEGQDHELLLVGKVSLRNAPALRALSRRGIVRPPAMLPRFFESADARRRLQQSQSLSVRDLVAEVIQ